MSETGFFLQVRDAIARTAVLALAVGLCTLPALAQDGTFGQGHAELHGWYQRLHQPGNGFSCCSDQDCRPTQWRAGATAIEVKVDGTWCPVPQDRILPISAPDGQAHVCTPPIAKGQNPCTVPMYCVVIGFGS